MQYLFILIFILVYCFYGKELGFTSTSLWYTHFTYMFQHAGWIHLIMNSIAFVGIFRVLKAFYRKRVICTIILISAYCSSLFSSHSIPTMGASGMIYAMFGMFTSLLVEKQITWNKNTALFYGSIILTIVISLLKPNSNFLLHVYSMFFGFIYSLNYWIINNYKYGRN